MTSGLVGLGEEVTWRAKHFGIWQELTSRTTAVVDPFYFQVTMVRGIFQVMQAEHLFREVGAGVTEMRDVFSVAAPLGVLGLIAEGMFPRRYMLGLLRERNEVIKGLAEGSAWERYLPVVTESRGGAR